jgi:hypothetical protein
MGKQYNKTIKRRRRLAYIERKKIATAAKGKSAVKSRPAAKKTAAVAAPAA